MNEAEWLVSTDPAAMLHGLQGSGTPLWHSVAGVTPGGVPKHLQLSDRKLRLFGEACCLVYYRGKTEVAEDLSVNQSNPLDWAQRWCLSIGGTASGKVSQGIKAALLRDIVGNPWRPVNRFPPGSHEFGWLTWNNSTVPRLAQSIYDGRRFDELPILADALEEAGCPLDRKECDRCDYRAWEYPEPNKTRMIISRRTGVRPCRFCGATGYVCNPLLTHLRSPGPHVRGCWALDLLLGRE